LPATSSFYWNGATSQGVILDVPLANRANFAPSEITASSQWRQEGPVFPYIYQSPYSYNRPGWMPSRLGSVADASGSVRNVSIGGARNGFYRREDLYRTSQNPWGSNTVFGPMSRPTDMHSWQMRDQGYQSDCLVHLDGRYQRPSDRNVHSKYQRRHGVVRRVSSKIVDVGGRLCQNFLVWVLFVAALAGMEGFKEKCSTVKPDDFSDSDAESEYEKQSKFVVSSFKGWSVDVLQNCQPFRTQQLCL